MPIAGVWGNVAGEGGRNTAKAYSGDFTILLSDVFLFVRTKMYRVICIERVQVVQITMRVSVVVIVKYYKPFGSVIACPL